ncbi:MAG TPA: hypothetical protein VK181_16630 [Rhizobium sp.]|nr:hypothetical protein [Rhizobium sp.]
MLEEKLDLLTKEVVALRKAVEANTAAGGATASGKGKPAASDDDDGEDAKPTRKGRGAPAKGADKKKVVEPEHDKDDVESIIRKVSKEVGKPVAKKIISSFKCDDLADLLTHPEHFDAAYEKAEQALEGDEGDDEDEI